MQISGSRLRQRPARSLTSNNKLRLAVACLTLPLLLCIAAEAAASVASAAKSLCHKLNTFEVDDIGEHHDRIGRKLSIAESLSNVSFRFYGHEGVQKFQCISSRKVNLESEKKTTRA